jgi:hypothetical protein
MKTGNFLAILAALGMAGGTRADIAWIDFGPETNRTAAAVTSAPVAGFDSVTRAVASFAAALDARRYAIAWQDGDLDTREPKGVMIIFR